MSRAEGREIAERIAQACETVGLDVIHPFNVATSRWAELGPGADLSPLRSDALGLVIGNTRKLWPPFVREHRSDVPHPLDRYVTEHVTRIVLEATTLSTRLFFSHVVQPAPFPMQRLAERVGLASLSPSHLAVHPIYGPWFALRAVVVVDVEGPEVAPVALVSPCLTCSAPCVPALERALAISGTPLDAAAVSAHARDWIAVRDACPVGRASRYGDAQLDYHYAPAPQKLAQGS